MTTKQIICTLAVLAALALVASLSPAPSADAPVAGTDTVLVAATPAPSVPAPVAPAPVSSPLDGKLVVATLLTMLAVKRRDHEGEAVRYRLDLDAVCGVDWSTHQGFLSAKEAEAPRLKLIQLLANRAAFYNVSKALSRSASGYRERWSLPLKAVQALVDRLDRRNSRAIEKYEKRISSLIGIEAGALTAESEREGYILLDEGVEEDDAGYPLMSTHRWEIDLLRKEFRIY